jgi:peroxiredoxin
MIKVGDKAPVFSLMDTERNEFTNSNIVGHITLFLFFPAAFTSTCTTELCCVRDDIARYQNLRVQVFGISTDALFTLKKYKEDQQLNFELLSDFNKEVSRSFGSLYEVFKYNMKGVSKRSAFVIDEMGVIQYVEVLENASHVPDFNLINRKLEVLSSNVK